MINLESIFNWKVSLLTNGCRIAPGLSISSSVALKKIHLYAHSAEHYLGSLPDDLVLSEQTICRIRYQSNSFLVLEPTDVGHQIRNEKTGDSIAVCFISRPAFSDLIVAGSTISSICSFLGGDVLGITPSNYCFYFQEGKQCKFCEILPTFKKEVDYHKTFKSLDVIEASVITALKNEPRLRFLAVTTGNVFSYDATVDYFVKIGERLQKDPVFSRLEQVLATLMPPDDLSKIVLLKKSGFTKVYFPLEAFDPAHFSQVCPGKADYGYERILEALKFAVTVFGEGNVYTNFVYGIQSLNGALNPLSYDAEQENIFCMRAVKAMLSISVIPAFTLYHYAGYNPIGTIGLEERYVSSFFREWGELVHASGLVPHGEEAVLFSPFSLSNTLFNDGHLLASQKENIWI